MGFILRRRGTEEGRKLGGGPVICMSSIVNDKGKVVSDMPIYTEGYVIDTVYASSSRTLYSYIGNLFVYVCIAAIFVPFIFEIIYKKNKKSE